MKVDKLKVQMNFEILKIKIFYLNIMGYYQKNVIKVL